jgi:DNA-binding MarR family transcriptional regulator
MSETIKFNFGIPEENSGYLLWQLTMLWQRKMKKALDELDLTHTQFVLLAALGWLSKIQRSVTQVDIANHSNTDRMMVSKVLRTLQAKEYIHRHEHETDTRAKQIKLTSKGQSILQNALAIVENVDNSFFGYLKENESDFKMNLLTLVKENKIIE